MKKLPIAMAVAGLLAAAQASAIVVTPTNDGSALAANILGSGINISNVSYTGALLASGTFTGGLASGFGIDSGIILTSGAATNAVGPNNADGAGTENLLPGYAPLNALLPGFFTADATVLSFDFTSTGGDLFFNYVFASEEYNEYVNSAFNDVFAFFLDGVNIATIPGSGGTPVSINNLNCGNPFGSADRFCDLYNNNDLQDGGGGFNTQYDGFTDMLTAAVFGLGAGTHTMALAIADAGDFRLDSGVLLQAGSFSDGPPGEPSPVPEPTTFALLGAGLLGVAVLRRRRGCSADLSSIQRRSGADQRR